MLIKTVCIGRYFKMEKRIRIKFYVSLMLVLIISLPITFAQGITVGQELDFPSNTKVTQVGDSNDDGITNIGDAVSILDHLFQGGLEPPCMEAADTNFNGEIDLTDVVFTLNYLFLGGPAPPDMKIPEARCGLGLEFTVLNNPEEVIDNPIFDEQYAATMKTLIADEMVKDKFRRDPNFAGFDPLRSSPLAEQLFPINEYIEPIRSVVIDGEVYFPTHFYIKNGILEGPKAGESLAMYVLANNCAGKSCPFHGEDRMIGDAMLGSIFEDGIYKGNVDGTFNDDFRDVDIPELNPDPESVNYAVITMAGPLFLKEGSSLALALSTKVGITAGAVAQAIPLFMLVTIATLEFLIGMKILYDSDFVQGYLNGALTIGIPASAIVAGTGILYTSWGELGLERGGLPDFRPDIGDIYPEFPNIENEYRKLWQEVQDAWLRWKEALRNGENPAEALNELNELLAAIRQLDGTLAQTILAGELWDDLQGLLKALDKAKEGGDVDEVERLTGLLDAIKEQIATLEALVIEAKKQIVDDLGIQLRGILGTIRELLDDWLLGGGGEGGGGLLFGGLFGPFIAVQLGGIGDGIVSVVEEFPTVGHHEIVGRTSSGFEVGDANECPVDQSEVGSCKEEIPYSGSFSIEGSSLVPLSDNYRCSAASESVRDLAKKDARIKANNHCIEAHDSGEYACAKVNCKPGCGFAAGQGLGGGKCGPATWATSDWSNLYDNGQIKLTNGGPIREVCSLTAEFTCVCGCIP
jgi:hypothetical protein